MQQETLDLSVNGVTSRDGVSLGQLTVSVVFRPVDSVALCCEWMNYDATFNTFTPPNRCGK